MTRPLPESVEAVRAILDVSRESAERLSIYVDLLKRWQKRINLVSGKTVENLWTRHVADSAQALAAAPNARRWMDLGSGAGFPGIVTAILLAETPGASVDLVESDQRKASFLRTVSRETGIPATVHVARIEDVVADWTAPVDAVSARALAPLSRLCGYTESMVGHGAVAVFHKGRDFSRELEEANRFWIIDLVEKVSSIEPDSRIVVIRHLQRR
ncbi:16S rRNA (guanine(527)-N(7))-methyltransferase RsmG [Rhodobium gokarnense]|uniref:Ribosomal RNA small subunit methyltransferase G n=1 Tax=Rhodobium gokarnense TaxID=364296 RepID=A0ABT3HE23_9HYPH|nr:16S rRNA (guanine(527)-N(7))-methyltransferase RsmG [Rhodobium gokarnense]MCW2308657.1 16S rRNA (guanine527-N7)-methyltransferase [Rhodobium gokarnense]